MAQKTKKYHPRIVIFYIILTAVFLYPYTSGTLFAAPVNENAMDPYIWVTSPGDNQVIRVNRISLPVEDSTITVGWFPKGIALDEDYIWVANSFDNTVTRIDRSDDSQRTISVGAGKGRGVTPKPFTGRKAICRIG